MDRSQATEALQLLRQVVSQARDDTALQNWGAIWIANGVSNAAAFLGTHLLYAAGHRQPGPFALLWGGVIAFNLASIYVLKRRAQPPAGARSFFERQIWAIWTSYIVAMVLCAWVNYLLGLDRLFMGPVACVLSALSFAAMGSLMGAVWYVPAGVFAVAALGLCLVPAWQFAVLGVLWAVTQPVAGVLLALARRRRLRAGAAPRLV